MEIKNLLGESRKEIEDRGLLNLMGSAEIEGLLKCRDTCSVDVITEEAAPTIDFTMCDDWTLVGQSWNEGVCLRVCTCSGLVVET